MLSYTNVHALLPIPRSRSWPKQGVAGFRSGPDGTYTSQYSLDHQNADSVHDFGGNNGVKANQHRSTFLPFGSISSQFFPSENPASPSRSFSNNLGDMGLPSPSTTSMSGEIGKLLSPGVATGFRSNLNSFIPQPSSPLTGSKGQNAERRNSAPQSTLARPQSSYGRQMHPGRSPQRSMSRSPSGATPKVQYVGKDGKETTPEKIYEELMKDMLKDPPSLIPTAVVRVFGPNGRTTKARILLDSGAQGCSIYKGVVQNLDLSRSHLESAETISHGVGGADRSTHNASLNLCSRFSNFCLPVKGSITERPIDANTLLDPKAVSRQSNLQLAEDEMPESNNIDMLVGVDYFDQLFLHEVEPLHIKGFPTFYKTNFGWMAFGKGAPGFKYMVMPPEIEKQLAATRKKLGLE